MEEEASEVEEVLEQEASEDEGVVSSACMPCGGDGDDAREAKVTVRGGLAT